MVNFVLGDLIAMLNSAKKQRFLFVNVKNSRLIKQILVLLVNLGILNSIKILDFHTIQVSLKYNKNRCVFKQIKVISIPSRRIYVDLVKLYKLKDISNTSIFILSTSKGLKTDLECFLEKISGEILLKIDL